MDLKYMSQITLDQLLQRIQKEREIIKKYVSPSNPAETNDAIKRMIVAGESLEEDLYRLAVRIDADRTWTNSPDI